MISFRNSSSQIFRKAALRIVQGTEEELSVTEENLHEYVGKPLFNSDRIYDETPPGVVMGLAWTSLGTLPPLSALGLMICSYYPVWKVDFGKYWSSLSISKKNRAAQEWYHG